jgi:hypothetical protein
VKLRVKPKKILNKRIPFLILLCSLFLIFGFFLGWKNVPGFLKANAIVLTESRMIDALIEENDLETIQIDVSFKNFQKIEARKNEAIKLHRLISSDEDFVKAEITHKEQTRRCQIRLKGDLPDHWSGDKFSLRVEMKGDALLNGMSKFSLQDPATRFDTEEWLFLENLRSEDCMAVRYDFVNLVINGKRMGIYAIEEHFSKELIEFNKRREGVIVKFDDYYIWRKHQSELVENISWQSFYRASPPQFRNNKRVSSVPHLLKQAENAVNLLRILQNESLPASQIFDINKLGKFLAVTQLWQASHALEIDDINFFFNPVTSLLEPVGFDGEPGLYPHSCLITGGWMKDTWVHYSLKDPHIVSSYLKHLEIFSNPKYVEQIKSKLFDYEFHIRKLLLSELLWEDPTTIWKNARKIFEYDPWVNFKKRIKKIRDELEENRPLFAHFRVSEDNLSEIKVTLRNCTTFPLEIVSILHLNEKVNLQDIITNHKLHVSPSSNNIYLPSSKEGILHIKDDLDFVLDTNKIFKDFNASTSYFTIETKFLGTEFTERHSTFSVDRTFFSSTHIPLGTNEFELQNLLYNVDQENKIISIDPGIYKIYGNIFIPPGHTVVIHPNTTLEFSSNSTFVCQGNIIARGRIGEPITFTSGNKSRRWPGILLYSTNRDNSYFDHVYFQNISGIGTGPNKNGIARNGWTMTGGVTVFNCPANFTNCYFENIQTEDALNIISSRFSLNNVTFNNAVSDAFDGDFVEGTISNCSFSNIAGDGLDFSGSNVLVTDCKFKNISDKAVSIGENSRAKVSKTNIENVAYGIVSKDQSVTNVENKSIIKNANIAAFSAFQKKPLFGPAKIKVYDSTVISSTKDFLIQDGSTGWNNDVPLATESFNASDLYNNPDPTHTNLK